METEDYLAGTARAAKRAIFELREVVDIRYAEYKTAQREFMLNHPNALPSDDPVASAKYAKYSRAAALWDELVQFANGCDGEVD